MQPIKTPVKLHQFRLGQVLRQRANNLGEATTPVAIILDADNRTVVTLDFGYGQKTDQFVAEQICNAVNQLVNAQEALKAWVDGEDIHEEGCPEDDTCECRVAKLINDACRSIV